MLGRLGADRFLGGEMTLDVDGARSGRSPSVGKPLGHRSRSTAADGILRIAATTMSYVGEAGVTTERGLDAGDFVLVAYGGAGPLHAVAVAREIGIAQRDHPARAGHVLGLRHAVLRPALRLRAHPSDAACRRAVRRHRDGVQASWSGRAATPSRRPRSSRASVTVQRALDMRYVGQEHAVTVELPLELFPKQDRAGIKTLFDAVHLHALRLLGAGREGRDREPARRHHRA